MPIGWTSGESSRSRVKLGRDFDVFNAGGRFGDGLTVFAQAFDVKLYGFVNQLQDFFSCICRGDTAGQA